MQIILFKEVQLPVVSTAECEFNYRLYFPNQVFDNRVLCAGFSQGGKDSCQVRFFTPRCIQMHSNLNFLVPLGRLRRRVGEFIERKVPSIRLV